MLTIKEHPDKHPLLFDLNENAFISTELYLVTIRFTVPEAWLIKHSICNLPKQAVLCKLITGFPFHNVNNWVMQMPGF